MRKKAIILFLLIMISIVSITAVSAATNATCDMENSQLDDKIAQSEAIQDTSSLAKDQSEMKVANAQSDDSQVLGDYDDEDNNVNLKASNLVTYYNSGKTFNVKAVYRGASFMEVSGAEVYIDVYTGKTYKTYHAITDSNGIAKFKLSTLPYGNHKVKVYYYSEFSTLYLKANVLVKINKAPTKVIAPITVVNKGASNYFKVGIRDNNGKVVKNLKLFLKVFTGKTYRYYAVKTNNYGIAFFRTNGLAAGIHNVLITSGNYNYKVAKLSRIIVRDVKTPAVRPVYKSVILKVRYTDYPIYKRIDKGDVVLTHYEYKKGRQHGIGVHALMSHGLGLSDIKPSHKLVASKVWFKNPKTGQIITRTSNRLLYNAYITVGLVNGYIPFKTQIWYRNI